MITIITEYIFIINITVQEGSKQVKKVSKLVFIFLKLELINNIK